MRDTFKTICGSARKKIAIGNCRFIASLSPSANEEEARHFIEKVKEKFSDANHNTFAYRIKNGKNVIARGNDDGEPAGTAGKPMLSALEKADLLNVVVVGTRYFGGVKLGIGGLVRAYRSCAEAGLEEAKICVKSPLVKVKITVNYNYLGNLLNDIEGTEAILDNIDYGEKVMVRIISKEERWPLLKKRINNSTRGSADISFI